MMSNNEAKAAHQYALVTWLAKEFGRGDSLGKKALQKLVYILDAIMGLRTGYSFQLYTYGPFSRDLAGDIDILDTQKAIKITYINTENRYIVSNGENTDRFIKDGFDFIRNNQKILSALKDKFTTSSAKELELLSTLHFLSQNNLGDSEEALIQKLMTIKPKYGREETLKGLQKVRDFESFIAEGQRAA